MQTKPHMIISAAKPTESEGRTTILPGIAAVIAATLEQGPCEILVIDLEALPVAPLHCREPVGSPDFHDDSGRTPPGSSVFGEDDTTHKVTPVDLNLSFAEGNGTDGASGCHFTRVEVTLMGFDYK